MENVSYKISTKFVWQLPMTLGIKTKTLKMANHHLSQVENAQNLWTGPLMTREMHWFIFPGGGQKSKVMRKNSSFVCLFWREKPQYLHLYVLSLNKKAHTQEKGQPDFHTALRFPACDWCWWQSPADLQASTAGNPALVFPKHSPF